jgi:flagellar L-ring protein precursor FlgH
MMKRRPSGTSCALLMAMCAPATWAQSSSLGKRAEARIRAESEADADRAAVAQTPRTHPAVERRSLIAVEPRPPKTYAIGDHVTVIVREQLTFEADQDSESKNNYEVSSEIAAFAKPIDGGLGATTFSRGKPNIDYKFEQERRNEADVASKNRLVTRLTAEIIDVKPNGNLVIAGRAEIRHGEEVSLIHLTGTCSKKKLSLDDSVLSTDIADKQIRVENRGSVHDGAKRGWLSKIMDTVKPF